MGRTGIPSPAIPPLSTVVQTVGSATYGALLRNAAGVTTREALAGFALCVLIAGCVVVTGYFLQTLWSGFDSFATVSNAIPTVTLAPILIAFVAREQVPVATAVVAAYFPCYTAFRDALQRGRAADRDVFRVLGASRLRTLLLLDFPAAASTLIAGMPIVLTGAFHGAVLGEWFGAEQGLGVVILAALQNGQYSLLWSASAVAAALSILAYAACSALAAAAHRQLD
jgi:NitT/TauT family transport system permease protein